jgi:predicted DNA binding CopG/RHH family protein
MEDIYQEKRFIMRLSSVLHDEIKKRAKKRNMTMTRYITCLINEQIIKENRYEQSKL